MYNVNHPIKKIRYAKQGRGQENVIHSEEKNQSIEAHPKITETADQQLL